MQNYVFWCGVQTVTTLSKLSSTGKTVNNYCQPGSYSSKMAHRLTHHIKHRIGLSHTILPSFQRISGHPIRQILILLTITYGEPCWTSTKSTHPNQQARLNWKSSCRPSGTTCHKPPLTEQYWRSERDCRHALHLKADTLNTSFASSQNGSFQSHDSFRVTNRFFSELTTLRGQEKQKLNCSCIVCCVHVKLKLGGSVA